MEQVKVYRFSVYDMLRRTELVASRAATLQTIRRIQSAKVIAESGKEVDRNRIDWDGFLAQ